MAEITSDPLSQIPLIISLKYEDTKLAIGTGFFYKRNEHLFLISNWHNFSGRDPTSKETLSANKGVPNKVSCYMCLNEKYILREWVDFVLSENQEAKWLQHPTLGSQIDIGALPVEVSKKFKPIILNERKFDDMRFGVSHDVYVLGYPLGLIDKFGLPIWKRASVATEPGTSDPYFLVDTATRAGMSGSPVIFRYRGFYKQDTESAVISTNDWFGEGDKFVGVYSGRLGVNEVEAQLGIVWKSHLIDEIIDGNVTANVDL